MVIWCSCNGVHELHCAQSIKWPTHLFKALYHSCMHLPVWGIACDAMEVYVLMILASLQFASLSLSHLKAYLLLFTWFLRTWCLFNSLQSILQIIALTLLAAVLGSASSAPQYEYEPPVAPSNIYETPSASVQQPSQLYLTPAESVQKPPTKLYQAPPSNLLEAQPQNIVPSVVRPVSRFLYFLQEIIHIGRTWGPLIPPHDARKRNISLV